MNTLTLARPSGRDRKGTMRIAVVRLSGRVARAVPGPWFCTVAAGDRMSPARANIGTSKGPLAELIRMCAGAACLI
jgi:hypothetical protein